LCIKKILIIPLAAVMLATLLAVAPTGSSDVPVLSTLQAEPADAHTATKQVTKWRNVCRWESQRVQVVVGYTNPNTRLPRAQRGPIYEWKTELVEVCEREYYTVTQNRGHWHPPSKLICDIASVWVSVAAGGYAAIVTAPPAAAAAPATGGTSVLLPVAASATAATFGYFVTREVCKTIFPPVVYYDWVGL
jgi:hypothetical protein